MNSLRQSFKSYKFKISKMLHVIIELILIIHYHILSRKNESQAKTEITTFAIDLISKMVTT